jgi:hypothetical protein
MLATCRGVRWRCAYLNKVLTLGLRDEGLQLRCGEGVYKTRLGDDEEQHLRAGEDGQLVGLDARVSEGRSAGVVVHATRLQRGWARVVQGSGDVPSS